MPSKRAMNRTERLAKYVIETIHKGAIARFREVQSAGEYDFHLIYADGSTAALEVISSTIRDHMEMLARLNKHGASVPVVNCQNSWMVEVLPTAWIADVRDRVDQYLVSIEAEGLDHFFAKAGAVTSSAVARIFTDLQVIEGQIISATPPPRIWITDFVGTGRGHWVGAADLQSAVEAEADQTDNKRKLAASQLRERHLFVWIEPLNSEAWSTIINGCIPDEPPLLPPEITHVWAAAEAQGQIRVWLANPPAAWRDMGLLLEV